MWINYCRNLGLSSLIDSYLCSLKTYYFLSLIIFVDLTLFLNVRLFEQNITSVAYISVLITTRLLMACFVADPHHDAERCERLAAEHEADSAAH